MHGLWEVFHPEISCGVTYAHPYWCREAQVWPLWPGVHQETRPETTHVLSHTVCSSFIVFYVKLQISQLFHKLELRSVPHKGYIMCPFLYSILYLYLYIPTTVNGGYSAQSATSISWRPTTWRSTWTLTRAAETLSVRNAIRLSSPNTTSPGTSRYAKGPRRRERPVRSRTWMRKMTMRRKKKMMMAGEEEGRDTLTQPAMRTAV